MRETERGKGHFADTQAAIRSFRTKLVAVLSLAAALALCGSSLRAHAILLQSSPAIHATVAGPEVTIDLRFNVRVDVVRSRFSLVCPDTTVRQLVPEKQASPDEVSARAAGLVPGPYTIRWQVLAPDGHISRGEVPFKVGKS
jgi:methionine-rich copper-binding protein CopC